MTQPAPGPLRRPFSVLHLRPEGADVTVEATPEECEALAADFGLPAIRSLVGRFRLAGSARRVEVTGRVAAEVTQICVVTLDEFETSVEEEVEVDFVAGAERAADADVPGDPDAPDALVNGQVDLGALAAEFLALGLDPYPRKPGVTFQQDEADSGSGSPFQALKPLTSHE